MSPTQILPRLHFMARQIQPGLFVEADQDGKTQIHELTIAEAESLQSELRTAANAISKALRTKPLTGSP